MSITKTKEIPDQILPKDRMATFIQSLKIHPAFSDKITAGKALRSILEEVETIAYNVNSQFKEDPYQMTVPHIDDWKIHRVHKDLSFSLHPKHLVFISKKGAIQILLLKDLPKGEEYDSNVVGNSDRDALEAITKKVLLDKRNSRGESIWPMF